MDELVDIAKPVVDKTDAQYGILHRPNKGPDYIMVFQAYGNDFVDPETGNLLLERDKLAAAFGWFERGVKEGVIPANNTAMEFDALRKEFYTGNAGLLDVRHLGPRDLTPSLPTGCRRTRPLSSPTGDGSPARLPKGRFAGSLTHPIVYAVAADAADPELAVRLLGHASAADLNTDHAVTTTHLGIKPEQLETRATPRPGRSRGDRPARDHQVPAQQRAVRRP